jgi:hypothetical protein
MGWYTTQIGSLFSYNNACISSSTRQPPEGWMSDPFSIPVHLQNDAREIESSLATFSHNNMYLSNDPWKEDSIREYVYS